MGTLPPRVFGPDILTDTPDGTDTTVPLPPPRPLRLLPLSKLTSPLTVLPPLPLSTLTLMPLDTLTPLPTPDLLPTPMAPLSPLSPQMSSLPAKNIWLPMPPLKQENQLVM